MKVSLLVVHHATSTKCFELLVNQQKHKMGQDLTSSRNESQKFMETISEQEKLVSIFGTFAGTGKCNLFRAFEALSKNKVEFDKAHFQLLIMQRIAQFASNMWDYWSCFCGDDSCFEKYRLFQKHYDLLLTRLQERDSSAIEELIAQVDQIKCLLDYVSNKQNHLRIQHSYALKCTSNPASLNLFLNRHALMNVNQVTIDDVYCCYSTVKEQTSINSCSLLYNNYNITVCERKFLLYKILLIFFFKQKQLQLEILSEKNGCTCLTTHQLSCNFVH